MVKGPIQAISRERRVTINSSSEVSSTLGFFREAYSLLGAARHWDSPEPFLTGLFSYQILDRLAIPAALSWAESNFFHFTNPGVGNAWNAA